MIYSSMHAADGYTAAYLYSFPRHRAVSGVRIEHRLEIGVLAVVIERASSQTKRPL
jgi:hypothetical protein